MYAAVLSVLSEPDRLTMVLCPFCFIWFIFSVIFNADMVTSSSSRISFSHGVFPSAFCIFSAVSLAFCSDLMWGLFPSMRMILETGYLRRLSINVVGVCPTGMRCVVSFIRDLFGLSCIYMFFMYYFFFHVCVFFSFVFYTPVSNILLVF